MGRSSYLIGKAGEKAFDLLCTNDGLICNKSVEDMAGWDFLVQADLDRLPGVSLDHRPAPLAAFFQVKSAGRPIQRVGLRLSNAERMIKELKPTFIFLNDCLNGQTRRTVAHIGSAAIEFILKKLRSIDPDKSSVNKINVHIPRDIFENRNLGASDNILDAIKYFVPDGMEAYATRKHEVLKMAGFTQSSYEASFVTDGGVDFDAMVSLLLGEREEVPVKSFTMHETRFGIRKISAGPVDARMSVQPKPVGIAQVVFRGHDPRLVASFECDVFVPGIPGLPEDQFRIRLKHKQFDFSIGTSAHHFKFASNLKHRELFAWSELRNQILLAEIFAGGEASFTCYSDGRPFARGHLTSELKSRHSLDDVLRACAAFDCLTSEPHISPLVKLSFDTFYAHLPDFQMLGALMERDRVYSVKISAELDGAPDQTGQSTRMLFPFQVHFPDFTLTSIFEVTGISVTRNGICDLDPIKAKLLLAECHIDRANAKPWFSANKERFSEERENELFLISEIFNDTTTD